MYHEKGIRQPQIAGQLGLSQARVSRLLKQVVEVGIVRIALITMKWITGQHKLFRVLEYLTTSVILLLSITSFVAAYRMSGFVSPLPIESLTPFWSGAFLSLTNPLHIPFWLGWTTVLMNKNILQPIAVEYNWYVIGIGFGTILGFAVFIYAGNSLVSTIQRHESLLNCVIGIVLLITAIVQIKKMVEIPSTVRYNKTN